MESLQNTRESFLKLRGGKLISVEAIVTAIIILFVMIIKNNESIGVSLVVAAIVAFVFPILIGVFKALAWLAAVLFSLIWGIIGFSIIEAITNDFVLIGFVGGIIIFLLSFRIHKNYSGLTFRGVTRKNMDGALFEDSYIEKEEVKFCPICGRRITSSSGICDVCNK